MNAILMDYWDVGSATAGKGGGVRVSSVVADRNVGLEMTVKRKEGEYCDG